MTRRPRHLVALGDSHLEALEFASRLNILDIDSSCFSIVPGATVVGLRNPNSLTNAVDVFRSTLLVQPKVSSVLIHLGEVDCGFVIWWRAKKYGESVEKQFQESLDAYRNFLIEIMEKGFFHLCIAGASLPTLSDGVDHGEIANKRAEICVSIQERTELTLRYNYSLAEIASQLNIAYFDLADAVLDKSSKLVHDFFRNPNTGDHHLDKDKVVALWATECNAFVRSVF